MRGRPRTRSRLLQKVELLTASDTDCQATGIRSEQTYRITYSPDPVTGMPRLTHVDMLGPATGVTTGVPLPVVTYRYGYVGRKWASHVRGGREHILLPAGPNGAHRGFGATAGAGGGAINGHIRGFRDMNGDGRADFVSLNSAGNAPVLAINRPSGLGNDYSTLPATVTLPNAPVAPYNLGTPDLSFNLPVVAPIDNTYQEVIDFNGDGRPDIITATEGRNDAGQRDPNSSGKCSSTSQGRRASATTLCGWIATSMCPPFARRSCSATGSRLSRVPTRRQRRCRSSARIRPASLQTTRSSKARC